MAFIFLPPSACSSPPSTPTPLPSRRPRRSFLQSTICAAAALMLPLPTFAHPSAKSGKQWSSADLCASCGGSGRQRCALCDGNGVFAVDDAVVQYSHECPNCMGKGDVRCPACIGLGLREVRGILRDGMSFRDPFLFSSFFSSSIWGAGGDN